MYFNRLQRRSGKVAEDRPHTTLIKGEEQEIRAVLYIHANPVRAGIVKDARNYYWSTHRLYAFGKREPWMKNIKLPDWYMRLGRNFEQRQRRYRKLFARYVKEEGRSRQIFLRKRFYGPQTWAEKRIEKVKAWCREHRGPPA
jgi:putative transposase